MPSLGHEIARHYGKPGRQLYCYTRSKLWLDPVYRATDEALRDSPFPLLDLGGGAGLLVAWLRAHGHPNPALVLDYDARKIALAQKIAQARPTFYGPTEFRQADLRQLPLPDHQGDVTILDILQFFDLNQRQALLTAAAERVPRGAQLILRQTLNHEKARRSSRLVDRLAKHSGWMVAQPTNYPSADEICATLQSSGLIGHFSPLPGKLRLDNWFASFRRPD